MANADAEKTYSTLERFLVFFIIPLIFTGILLTVMMSLLGYNVLGGLQNAAHQVPLFGKWVPASSQSAKPASAVQASASSAAAVKAAANMQKAIGDLKTQLAAKVTEIKKLNGQISTKEQSLKDMQSQMDTLKKQFNAKTTSAAEYEQKIQNLANVYAQMIPTKAGKILDNLSMQELVLVLSQMKQSDRVNVLQSMDPQKAADASIQLKDVVPAKDLQLAALQSKIRELEKAVAAKKTTASNAASSKKTMTLTDLGKTFANMQPGSAADILSQMETGDPKKVLAILTAMDAKPRSDVLTAMSTKYNAIAASIVDQLAQQ